MVCPFIECAYKGCRKMFTIQNIDKAVSVCANNFTQCEIFQKEIRKTRDSKVLQQKSA